MRSSYRAQVWLCLLGAVVVAVFAVNVAKGKDYQTPAAPGDLPSVDGAFGISVTPQVVEGNDIVTVQIVAPEGPGHIRGGTFDLDVKRTDGWFLDYLVGRAFDGNLEPYRMPKPKKNHFSTMGAPFGPREAHVRLPDLKPGTYRFRQYFSAGIGQGAPDVEVAATFRVR